MAIQPVTPQIPTTLPGSLTEEAIAVRGALLDRGLETPMTTNDLSRDQRYDVIRNAFGDIMQALGLDLRDDSLE
jgi:GTP cyclohydrolase I